MPDQHHPESTHPESTRTGRARPAPWWVRYPERWDQEITELEALTHLGVATTVVDLGPSPDPKASRSPQPGFDRGTGPDPADGSGSLSGPEQGREEATRPNMSAATFEVVHIERREVHLRIDDESRPLGAPSLVPGRRPGAGVINLRVAFPTDYPFFAPEVFDPVNALGLNRHRNPVDGQLCVIEQEDWRIGLTIARLLRDQLPLLTRASAHHHAWATPTTAVISGVVAPGYTRAETPIEIPGAERLSSYSPHVQGRPVMVVPDVDVPLRHRSGTFALRYALDFTNAGQPALAAGVVEHIAADGQLISGPDEMPRDLQSFVFTDTGRWVRDEDYDPAEEPAVVWERIQPLLTAQPPAQLGTMRPEPTSGGATAETGGEGAPGRIRVQGLETIGLLVPAEVGYREPGWEWVFLRYVALEEKTACLLIASQRLGDSTRHPSRPSTHTTTRARQTNLARAVDPVDPVIALIGVGAVGGHVAVDLARAAKSHLDLIDGDVIDIATRCRQWAPIARAGTAKVEALARHLRDNNPDIVITAHLLHLGLVFEDAHRLEDERRVIDLFRSADIVIDASANPAVTRYLNAVRLSVNKPLLVVSGTAGAWGGVVAELHPGSGCWACVEHHRLDKGLPVPPEDPDGSITPRGCASPSFTGTNADLASIAHHASRIALELLDAAPSTGRDSTYAVAALRAPGGGFQPIEWTSTILARHPDCANHAPGSSPNRERHELQNGVGR